MTEHLTVLLMACGVLSKNGYGYGGKSSTPFLFKKWDGLQDTGYEIAFCNCAFTAVLWYGSIHGTYLHGIWSWGCA